MKNLPTLLRLGGGINALFVLFHLFLGWQIHHWKLPADLRGLLEIFNGCGTLFILFLTVVSLGYTREALTTGVGRLTLWLAVTLYALRGLAEFIVTPRVTPAIVATCFVTSLLYGVILWLARGPRAQPAP